MKNTLSFDVECFKFGGGFVSFNALRCLFVFNGDIDFSFLRIDGDMVGLRFGFDELFGVPTRL